jgi:hypothetical protein
MTDESGQMGRLHSSNCAAAVTAFVLHWSSSPVLYKILFHEDEQKKSDSIAFTRPAPFLIFRIPTSTRLNSSQAEFLKPRMKLPHASMSSLVSFSIRPAVFLPAAGLTPDTIDIVLFKDLN